MIDRLTELAEIYFDGLCEPKNPGGIPVYAFVIFSGQRADLIAQDAGLAGEPWNENVTHNLAEYMGAINGIKWIREHVRIKHITIYGDSQLVIRQLTKNYKVRSGMILPLYDELTGLLEGLGWRAIWVPRKNNSLADGLANEFYARYCMKMYRRTFPTMRERGAI